MILEYYAVLFFATQNVTFAQFSQIITKSRHKKKGLQQIDP